MAFALRQTKLIATDISSVAVQPLFLRILVHSDTVCVCCVLAGRCVPTVLPALCAVSGRAVAGGRGAY